MAGAKEKRKNNENLKINYLFKKLEETEFEGSYRLQPSKTTITKQ